MKVVYLVWALQLNFVELESAEGLTALTSFHLFISTEGIAEQAYLDYVVKVRPYAINSQCSDWNYFPNYKSG